MPPLPKTVSALLQAPPAVLLGGLCRRFPANQGRARLPRLWRPLPTVFPQAEVLQPRLLHRREAATLGESLSELPAALFRSHARPGAAVLLARLLRQGAMLPPG